MAYVTADERESIVSACTGKRTNSQGFVRTNCPVCVKRSGKPDRDVSLGYRPETGGFRCFRCGVNGRIFGEGYTLPIAQEVDALPPVVIPRRDFVALSSEAARRADTTAAALHYLTNRGFSEGDIQIADMHYAFSGKYQGRVIVPHKEHGQWWGFTSRLIGEGVGPKVLYPQNMDRRKLYNEEVLYTATEDPVMLVEGCFDAIWYMPACVAALGKPTAAHFDKLVTVSRPIVFCLDGDAWEEGQALAYRLRLRGRKAGFVRLPAGEDPNTVNPTWLSAKVAEAELG